MRGWGCSGCAGRQRRLRLALQGGTAAVASWLLCNLRLVQPLQLRVLRLQVLHLLEKGGIESAQLGSHCVVLLQYSVDAGREAKGQR
jgi:hypothetical protein